MANPGKRLTAVPKRYGASGRWVGTTGFGAFGTVGPTCVWLPITMTAGARSRVVSAAIKAAKVFVGLIALP